MTSRPHIDLNCDLGESFGIYPLGHDERMMTLISSANVACGFHAGDPTIMRQTVRLALAHGVAVGAHPGFPDREGFGRRRLDASPSEVEDMVLYQVAALAGVAASEGGRLAHVKAHGALYNMAAGDRGLADAVARAVASFDRGLVLFGLAGSQLLAAGRDAGLAVASEVFADRAYDDDGMLVDRSRPGAMVTRPEDVVERAVRMSVAREVRSVGGRVLRVEADTICVHGDTKGAVDLARGIRAGLEQAGVQVRSGLQDQ